jgi:predicted alpha/beta-hydrolase family hydrolase
MNNQSFSLPVGPSIGEVSAELIVPDDPYCIITLAHGAGAGMDNWFMVELGNELANKGIANLRFNFPAAEQKKFRPDVPAVAHKTIAAAIDRAYQLFPGLPLFVSGKSFGGRMSSQLLSAHPDERVQGIIVFGFPLHPAKKPSIDRAEHLKGVKIPVLFLQGTKDELATLELIESVCASLSNATLIKIEKANHMFKVGKENIVAQLAGEVDKWLRTQTRAAI